MKKILCFCFVVLCMCGCSKTNGNQIIKELDKKITKASNYEIIGTLEIFRNEEKFVYDVKSTYQREDKFKVELINKTNDHEQIILKNANFVYVLTPSLNKSFKFQSDWPYNNSQIYLLQPIIADLQNDNNIKFSKNKKEYIIESKVNYDNEKAFKKQKVYFDLEKKLFKIEVLDDLDNIKMIFNIIDIKYDKSIEEDFFDINKYIRQKDISESQKTTSKEIKEIVYPMYVPMETYLTSQNIIDTEIGERAILTFSGESNFTLVQENIDDNFNESFVYGEPYLILDTIGIITDSTVTWISDGVGYSVISDTMSIDELLIVAQSLSIEPVGK